ncbi:hypothetical protein JCM11491_001687, partial [Sporobolomyces phaffii]
MAQLRTLSTRSLGAVGGRSPAAAFGAAAPARSRASLSSSASSSRSQSDRDAAAAGGGGLDAPVTARQIGKVARPARPTPPPKGPPKHKYPRALPASLATSPLVEFLATIPAIRNRPTLINDESCRDLVRAWGVERMGDNVTVVDTYAGAGGLSKAFLDLPNVTRVITIEDAFRYNPHLR